MKGLIWVLAIALVVGLIILLVPPPTPTPTSPRNTLPAWSPDGRQIAFSSDRDGNWEIYVLDVDTLQATRVTDNNALDWDPAWAPTGEHIAFVSNRDARSTSGYDIYTIEPYRRTVSRVTFRAYGWDGDPCWMPIASGEATTYDAHIVFVSDRDGNYEIYDLKIADDSVTRLTYRERNPDQEPTLSPDGRQIAFQSKVENNWEIFVMDVDGRNVKRLTFNPADDRQPAWSPDGANIAFASNRDGNNEIYVMDTDGKSKRNITNAPASDEAPTWSPDSQMIAFQSNRGGTTEIWRMNATDGTGQKQLTGLE